jgi:acetyl esterase
MSPTDMRAAAAARPVADPPEVASVQEVDAGGVKCRLYHPLGGSDAPPLVVFFHGGGWVLQFTDGHDTTARHLANKSGCAVLAVDYRLAPEHPFPAAYEDSWDATAWAFENLEGLGCRRGPIGLTGVMSRWDRSPSCTRRSTIGRQATTPTGDTPMHRFSVRH